jgi:transcription-repair coupling factor (superfamily II helicase)
VKKSSRDNSGIDRVLDHAAQTLGDRLEEVSSRSINFSLPAVAPNAQPFVAALVARRAPKSRIWVTCADVRSQESFALDLAAWFPGTRLFPELEMPATEDALPDPETASERLDILRDLAADTDTRPLVVHASQWDQEVPSAASIEGAALRIKKGERINLDEAMARVAEAGYERTSTAAVRGQFAVRGGIVDIYSWQAPLPIRIELDDDFVESIREFDPDSQISVRELSSTEILAGRLDRKLKPLRSFLKKDDIVITTLEDGDFPRRVRLSDDGDDPLADFHPQPFSDLGVGDLILNEAQQQRFVSQMRDWLAEKWMIVFASGSSGEEDRLREFLSGEGLDPAALHFIGTPVSRGFIYPAAKLAVLSDAELFGRAETMRARNRMIRRERARARRAAVDFSEFEPGDYVVHLDHGVGIFAGIEQQPGDDSGEVLVIEYADSAKLYVPLDQAWQVARYAGVGRHNPDLSTLGDSKWERLKEKARNSIYEYATRMLRTQAERETVPGHAFPPDTRWQQEFEDSFPYQETNDQLTSISESKADMESERPMDRLICGDVGFGKTEVAIRTLFKAVTGGKQAAMLAPTTVLAQQHFNNLRERMSDYPITIEVLSRYRTTAEQRSVLERLKEGGVDIVVGTHRLLSKDVKFKDLGLVVVDEEQRFGVKHKDALKERFRQVDVLTLSATPIPRTLYMALMGARDMSLIETPPANRQSVETIVCAYDERTIREACQRELARGGQVYFLHNRVKTIEKVAMRLRELCPGAKVVIGHGQMGDSELEPIMKQFVEGKADILVSTTIIESGLDIPRANTIIIDRADRFGLADLYQLRGRVGRADAKAYAYLMLPRDLMGAARRRVSALKQYSELGSGFKIAMRDLEIRGAGNLLGTAQSGHIIAIGFDLYCKMLRKTVDTLKGNRRGVRPPSGLYLDFVMTAEVKYVPSSGMLPAFLPAAYISDPQTRISCYRRLAEAPDRKTIEIIRGEWRDRFGPIPEPVENSLLSMEIRLEAGRRRISMVESRDQKLLLKKKGDFLQFDGRFPRLTSPDPKSRLREILGFLESLTNQ